MKRVLLFISIALLSIAGFAQSNYVNVLQRYRWVAGKFDSTLHVPFGTTPSLRTGGHTSAGALFYRTTDSSLYTYSGFQWAKVGTGTVTSISQAYGAAFSVTPITSTGSIGVDTSLMATRLRAIKIADSINSLRKYRFGVSGEDATGAEARNFTNPDNNITIQTTGDATATLKASNLGVSAEIVADPVGSYFRSTNSGVVAGIDVASTGASINATDGADISEIEVVSDSVIFTFDGGLANIAALRMANNDTAGYKPMVWNIHNKSWRYFNSWAELGLGGGGGTPGGSNTQVQFNDGGAFGGDADLVWDKTNNKLTINGVATNTEGLIINSNGAMQYIIQNQGGTQWLFYSDADATSGQHYYTATTAPIIWSINATEVGRFAGATGNLQLETKISEYANSAPTDGQLLIGHTANGTLEKATLTAGTGITVTNGAGAITITNSQTGFTTATVQTTNATATTLASIATTGTEIGVLEVTMVALQNSSDKRLTGKKIVRYYSDGATITLGSITSILADELTGFTTASWTITSSGANLIIQVTGEASTTAQWKASYVKVNQEDGF